MIKHDSFWQFIRNVKVVLGLNTIVVTTLAIISTYLCIYYNINIDFPLTVITIAVVFPIVFTIWSAYKRREVALSHYGTIKTICRSIYFASRDWIVDEDPKQSEQKTIEIKNTIKKVLTTTNNMLQADPSNRLDKEKAGYEAIDKLSKSINSFRWRGMAGWEVSRANAHLSKLISAFENLKHISQYRTPVTLRTYSKLFTYTLPIVYGPYFAIIITEQETNLSLAFAMPLLFSVVLISLANIQTQMEHPFDKDGEDDININIDKFMNNLD